MIRNAQAMPAQVAAGSAAVIRDVSARFQRDKETKARIRELEAKLGGG
jgi:hypothetical protein